MNLVAFPCSSELVPHLLDRIDVTETSALILEKQVLTLRGLLAERGIRDVFVLPENLYGKVSSPETAAKLAEIKDKDFARGILPLNDFCGNVALLLSILCKKVCAVSPTYPQAAELSIPPAPIGVPGTSNISGRPLREIEEVIVGRLKAFQPRLEEMGTGDRAGEKPTFGLLNGYPYDTEVLSRYAHAAGCVSGAVLEVGCGLGIGAYLMAKLNQDLHIEAVDNDEDAIAMARELWADDHRITFRLASAEQLPFRNQSFDSSVCFEVVEHLEKPDLLLAEIARVLQREGRLIGSTPNSQLFPYRVNEGVVGSPDELRREGIWPWHVSAFEEASVTTLLEDVGFYDVSIKYPSFVKGIDIYNKMQSDPERAIDYLACLDWCAADFKALDDFVPCFSGFSFVFSSKANG